MDPCGPIDPLNACPPLPQQHQALPARRSLMHPFRHPLTHPRTLYMAASKRAVSSSYSDCSSRAFSCKFGSGFGLRAFGVGSNKLHVCVIHPSCTWLAILFIYAYDAAHTSPVTSTTHVNTTQTYQPTSQPANQPTHKTTTNQTSPNPLHPPPRSPAPSPPSPLFSAPGPDPSAPPPPRPARPGRGRRPPVTV